MLETIVLIMSFFVSFLIAIGWYRRGFKDMEKEMSETISRLDKMEVKCDGVNTDIEVIKTQIAYIEEKVNDIHEVVMKNK